MTVHVLKSILPSSLGNRVFALYGVTLLLLVILGTGLFLQYQLYRNVAERELASVMLIEIVSEVVQDQVVAGDLNLVEKILGKAVQGSPFASAQFLPVDGRLIRADNALRSVGHAPAWLTQWVQHALVDVQRTIMAGNKAYGSLRLQYDVPAVAARLWSLSLFVAGTGLSSLVLGLLVIRLALSRWLGGLVRLRETVENMGTHTAQSQALVIDNAPAEIQSLVDIVNRTAVLVRERELSRRALDEQKFALDQHAIVSVVDAQGKVVSVNDRFCEITGYSRDEWLGRSLRDLRSGVHPQAFFDQIWETLFAGKVWRGEVCSRKRNGELYWVDTTMVPILADDGQSSHYITIRTDITARKRAEEERETAHAVLTARTAQLQAVLDHISQGVAMIAPDKSVVIQSRRVMELLEIPPHLHGAGLAAIIAYQTERGDFGNDYALVEESARDYLRAVARGEEASPPPLYRRSTVSGRTLEIATSTLPTGGIVRTFTDVTSYIQAQARAEQASIAKGQFLANMSHEIRTPMNAILGMLTLLKGTTLSTQQLDFANKTEDAARSLLGLLNDILDFSKVEAGKMTLDPRPFDLDKLLANVCVILAANIGSKPVSLRQVVSPAVPRALLGDDMRLQQVLINLGSNAVKFTEQGEVVLQVELVEHNPTGVLLVFSVSDTGIGIAPENHAYIFDGFSQAEASTTRRFGGTGLGLSISSRLVALFGGELKLRSMVGQGSTFYFQASFPVAQLPALAPAIPGSTHTTAAEKPKRLLGLRVLVVEDNKINQMVAKGLLAQEGAEVVLADDGQLGVTAVATTPSPFDAVLMDVQMPVMDGYTATRTLRADLGLVNLPIIAMTANAMASDRQACLEAGMNEHIGKPFELDHLVATLLRLCRK